ncbi:MAG: hypothetical protein U1E87_07100 [Alphaproteobacteria bacterium]
MWVEGRPGPSTTRSTTRPGTKAKSSVILIFEAWRPELSEEERALIAAMFRALDTFTGETPAWEI